MSFLDDLDVGQFGQRAVVQLEGPLDFAVDHQAPIVRMDQRVTAGVLRDDVEVLVTGYRGRKRACRPPGGGE